jgi:hypothetical protein
MLERAKTVRALDRSTTAIGSLEIKAECFTETSVITTIACDVTTLNTTMQK